MKQRVILSGIGFILSICIVTFIFTQRGSTIVDAGGDLSVDYGVPLGTPLFSVSNASPGTNISRTIKVYNDSSSKRVVAIRGLRSSPNTDLSAITIHIVQDTVDVYGGGEHQKTMADFFKESLNAEGIPLAPVASHSSEQFVITVSILPTAGNSLQNASIIFDLHVGVTIEIPEACKHIIFKGQPVYGSKRNDHLVGTADNDLIIGFEGNDVIEGKGGDDCIVGGDGNDILKGDSGNDVLLGGNGHDMLFGEKGADILNGEEGKDIGRGGQGFDICTTELKHECER